MQKRLAMGWVVGVLALIGCGVEPATTTYGTGGNNANAGDGDGDEGEGDGDSEKVGDGDGDAVGDGDTAGDGDTGNECGSIEKEAEVERGPIDVVIALDSSGSMSDEICNVSKNLTALIEGLGKESRVTTIYQIGWGLISQITLFCGTADPLANLSIAKDAQRYKRIDTMVNSNDGLSVLLNQYDNYKGFLREGSPTHFIMVSDDEDHTMSAEQFKTQMEAKLGHKFYYHAIVAEGGTCRGSGVGNTHMALADMTGGEKLSICATDWSKLFKQLESAVVATAPLACDFDIPAPPAGETLDPDAVQVLFTPVTHEKQEFPKAADSAQCGSKLGWYYNAEQRIQFCPAACEMVKAGGALSIGFGCEASILL